MAWTQTDLDNLASAIAGGVKVVQFQDRRVEYDSIKDMQNAYNTIAVFLSASSSPPITRQIRVFTDKGW